MVTSMLWLTWKRLLARPVMAFATVVGLAVAIGLMMSVPLYADAVNYRLLTERLANQTERNNRPPFAYLYNYVGAWHDPVEQAAANPITEYILSEAADTLGLPAQEQVVHYETGDFRLFPPDTPSVTQRQFGIDIFKFTFTSELADHIEITAGDWPQDSTLENDELIEVLIRDITAEEYDFSVGDTYVTYDLRSPLREPRTIPLTIAGIWRPIDPDDRYWLYAPDTYQDRLVVSENSWRNYIAEKLPDEVYLGAWYLVLDGSRVTTAQVDRLLTGAAAVDRQIARILPETQPLQSPASSLEGYRRDARALTFQLFAFNVPTVALALAFTGLVISLVVNERRNEIAIMRSRGDGTWLIISRFLLEGSFLSLVSLVLGSGLAWVFTNFMGQVRSFLNFSATTELRILFVPLGWWFGLGTIALFLCAAVWPVRQAAGYTIVSYRLSQARDQQRPWWQRRYLDLLLLAIAAWGVWQLFGGSTADSVLSQRNVFENPWLFLLPALFILAAILLFLRVLPFFMEALSRLMTFTDSIALLQAARNLSRTKSFFTTPFILLSVTVSLSVYTASLARTLDLQLFDSSWYHTGADLNLFTSPEPFGDQERFGGFASMNDNASDAYVFLPVSEYENVNGVEKGTRVGSYPAELILDSAVLEINYMGVDYDTFPEIAYWREDFSRYRLTTLMNAIAVDEPSVLVSEQLLLARNLEVGDQLEIEIELEDGTVLLTPIIRGSFELFPTWYPTADQELVVGRLDQLFAQAGAEFPYRLWLNTAGSLDDDRLQEDLLAQRIVGSKWIEPFTMVTNAQTQPARQGLFGLLSIGFIASVCLTVLGFFLYMFFSFQRRTVELGILRAVGLPFSVTIRLLAWELALLMGTGLVWGGFLGIVVSFLFIPFLQVGRNPAELVPPYLVEIAWPAIWQVSILFGLLFLIVLTAVAGLLSRMKLFQAIKLGETV